MSISERIVDLNRLNLVCLVISSMLFVSSIGHMFNQVSNYGWSYTVEQTVILKDDSGEHSYVSFIEVNTFNDAVVVIVTTLLVLSFLFNYDYFKTIARLIKDNRMKFVYGVEDVE